MKFKNGCPVEVLRRPDESFGAWFPARIISVDCHGYTVRFEHFLTIKGEQIVEKVNLGDIRPCPPFLVSERGWTLGDMVEVFDLESWKAGKVAKVLRNNRLVIRIFGSIQLREFHNSSIRVLQAWQHNKWVRIEKVNGQRQISNLFQKISPVGPTKRKFGFHLKSSPDDNITGNGKKQKSTLGRGQLATGTLLKEGNVISFPETKVAEKYLHATIKDSNIVPCGLDLRRVNTSMHAMQQSLPLRIPEENIECSVASCSGNFFPEYTLYDSVKSCRDMVGSSLGDAESLYPLAPGGKCCFAKDNLVEIVHMLELHAYKSTVQALYASGPLSWEQESLLTNLRLSLHISNEEHLLQLRNLLSAQVL
uniref:Protein EMSY n=1 Tax=Anthurium amnicola TaxID=1678845 RepID=A0A1D1XKH0_9ARAE